MRRWGRRALLVLALGGLVALAVVVDGALAWRGVDRFALAPPAVDDGRTTWLLVGSDDRADLGELAGEPGFGTEQGAGARADIVVVVQRAGDATRSVAISRDLLVAGGGPPVRLGLTLLDGPQALVDRVCHGLGIAVDHVAVLDMDGLAAIVDAMGGVDLVIRQPIRDDRTGLAIGATGAVHVDGATALAYARARSPEVEVGGEWVPAPAGDAGRVERATSVLTAVASDAELAPLHPLRSRRVARSILDEVHLSETAGWADARALRSWLSAIARSGGPPDLPVDRVEGAVPTATLAAGSATLLDDLGAGGGTTCRRPVAAG